VLTKQSPHVELRPLVRSDLGTLFAWWDEPEASYLDSGDRAGPEQDFRERVLHAFDLVGMDGWYIIEDVSKRPVGYVLSRFYPEDPKRAEVAIRLSERYWGQGLGTASFDALLKDLFRNNGVLGVWLTVYVFNRRAIRLYERFGFAIEESFLDAKGMELFKMTLPRTTWNDMNRSEACG